MNDNKHTHRHDNRVGTEADDDKLRPDTANEAIREATGNPNADLSQMSSGSGGQASGSAASASEDVQGSDLTQGMSLNPNDASAVRSGGTTDMDDQTAGGAGLAAGERGSSNLTTRRTVTGSDFDGQDKTS